MELVKVLEKLQAIYKEHGNCEVLMFDTQSMISRPVIGVKFTVEEDFREDLKDDEMYVENFKRELYTPVIL